MVLCAPACSGKRSLLSQWLQDWEAVYGGDRCCCVFLSSRCSNAATAWQELLQQLVWAIIAAAGLPTSDAHDGAHTQALHGWGDVYQDDYWSRRFSITCASAALKSKGPLLIALDLEGEVYACGSCTVGLETPLADMSPESLQGLLQEELDAAGTAVTPSQMLATSLPPLLPQNVVMVIATSSVELLHVARQRQWSTCVTSAPSTGAVSRLLEACVRDSGVSMSADTRAKFDLHKDALLQTSIAMNEWRRLATSFFDPVGSLPLGKSSSLLWDSVLQRWCEKEEGGRNGMSSTVLALIACSRHGLSYAELCALSGGTGAEVSAALFCVHPFLGGAMCSGVYSSTERSLVAAIFRRTMPTEQLERGTRLRIAKFFDTQSPLALRATLELPWQYYSGGSPAAGTAVCGRLSYLLAAHNCRRHCDVKRAWAVTTPSWKTVIQSYAQGVVDMSQAAGEWSLSLPPPPSILASPPSTSPSAAQLVLCNFVDSLDMRPQALEQWQLLTEMEAAAKVPVARASSSLLRVAVLLWRGGGEADGQAAAKNAHAACELLRGSMDVKPSHAELLSLADGMHVSLTLVGQGVGCRLCNARFRCSALPRMQPTRGPTVKTHWLSASASGAATLHVTRHGLVGER
jgi:hypothetical protein